jgi:hypothetical protein
MFWGLRHLNGQKGTLINTYLSIYLVYVLESDWINSYLCLKNRSGGFQTWMPQRSYNHHQKEIFRDVWVTESLKLLQAHLI